VRTVAGWMLKVWRTQQFQSIATRVGFSRRKDIRPAKSVTFVREKGQVSMRINSLTYFFVFAFRAKIRYPKARAKSINHQRGTAKSK